MQKEGTFKITMLSYRFILILFLVTSVNNGNISRVIKIGFYQTTKQRLDLRNVINIIQNYLKANISDDFSNMNLQLTHLDYDNILNKETFCSATKDLTSIILATSCPLINKLQKYNSSIPIFFLNIEECDIRPSRNLYIDRLLEKDLHVVINSVTTNGKSNEIVIVHDIQYESDSNVDKLINLFTKRRFQIILLAFDSQVKSDNYKKLVLEIINLLNEFRDTSEIRFIFITDYVTTLNLIYQIHKHDIPKGIILVMIVHGGWDPEMEQLNSKSREVLLSIDVPIFILKLEVVIQNLINLFTFIVTSNATYALSREIIFVAAAIYVQLMALSRLVRTESVNLFRYSDNCFPNDKEMNIFSLLIKEQLNIIGLSSLNLTYTLYRNTPVNSTADIFIPLKTVNNGTVFHTFNRKQTFQNLTLKLAVPNYPPYVIMKEYNDDFFIEEGPLTLLFNHLSKTLLFKYKFVHPKDNEWGIELESGNWTGAIGMLLNREADLAPFLMITKKSNEVISYTMHISIGMTSILIRKPTEPPRTFIFLRPFSSQVWYCILMSIPISSTILYLINTFSPFYYHTSNVKFNRGLFKFYNCFWYVYGAILQQGGIYLPDAISARIVVSTIWIFVIVIIATYSGNLIAFLTFPEASWIINSLEDLVNNYAIKLLIKDGSGFHQEIIESNLSILQKINYRIHHSDSVQLIDDIRDELDSIIKGRAAFMEEKFVLASIINEDFNSTGRCRIVLFPKNYKETFLSIGLRHGSPLLDPLNTEIRKLWNNGLLQFWIKKFFLTRDECSVVQTTLMGGKRGVNLKDLGGAFALYFIGITLAVTLLIIEWIYRKCKVTRKVQRKDINIRISVVAREIKRIDK